MEQAICSAPELPATILRLPMVHGPEDPLHRLYPAVKRMQGERPVILHEQSFAQSVPCRGYVENVAHAIVLAATLERSAGRVYDVAESGPYTEAEWTAKIGTVLGWRGRVIAVARHQAPQHLILPYNFEQHLFMDSARIRDEPGHAERVPVDEALRRKAEWERANPPREIDPAQYDYLAEDEAAARATV